MTQRLLLLLLFLAFNALGQDMQQGFTFLETGKYQEAKTFFEQILQQYPDNRTARLCYGRAVGLSGASGEAVTIFTQLKSEYPDDFEIQLNYAESLLWNKQFDTAETYYEKLVRQQSSSFPAVLGYANTLSNLKNYPKALEWVHKALVIEPSNQNALISRKYIRLGYAFVQSQQKAYQKALELLDKNLVDFPGDKESLLNKATIFLITDQYDAAETTYKTIAKNPKDSITALIGLSLVAHKQYKNKKALQFASEAKQKVQNYKEDKGGYLSAEERYVQALLWNRKFSKARKEITSLRMVFPNENRITSLEASLGMYTGNFDNSVSRYQMILDKEKSSFDGNLGIANAYRASGFDMKAYESAFRTLVLFPKQPDTEKLIANLKKSHTPFIEETTTFTFDNGDNEAINVGLRSEIPLSTRVTTIARYQYRTTQNTRTEIEAKAHEVSVGINYKFTGKMALAGTVGMNTAQSFTTSYTQMIAEVLLKTKPFAQQNLDVGYKRALQSFNADLIDREIVMNDFFLNYNLNTNINLGWYTQYIYTSQSDKNTRNLLFTSVYYTFLRRPLLKAGFNYQYIAFKEQLPTIYFSPEQFNLGEFFAEISNDQTKDWFYSVSAAFGQQFVNDMDASSTFRAEGKIGHQFSDRFKAHVYAKYSNIASATAAGFEFTEFGFKMKWYFLSKPLFDKKILALQEKNID